MKKFISIATAFILLFGLIMPTFNVALANNNPFKVTGIPDSYTVSWGNVEIYEVYQDGGEEKKQLHHKAYYDVSNDGTIPKFQLPTDIQNENDYVVRVTLNLRANDNNNYNPITYIDEKNYTGEKLKALASIAWDQDVVSVSYDNDDSFQTSQLALIPLNNDYDNTKYLGYINEQTYLLINPQKVKVLFLGVKENVAYSLFKDVNVTNDTKISFTKEAQAPSLKKIEVIREDKPYSLEGLNIGYGEQGNQTTLHTWGQEGITSILVNPGMKRSVNLEESTAGSWTSLRSEPKDFVEDTELNYAGKVTKQELTNVYIYENGKNQHELDFNYELWSGDFKVEGSHKKQVTILDSQNKEVYNRTNSSNYVNIEKFLAPGDYTLNVKLDVNGESVTLNKGFTINKVIRLSNLPDTYVSSRFDQGIITTIDDSDSEGNIMSYFNNDGTVFDNDYTIENNKKYKIFIFFNLRTTTNESVLYYYYEEMTGAEFKNLTNIEMKADSVQISAKTKQSTDQLQNLRYIIPFGKNNRVHYINGEINYDKKEILSLLVPPETELTAQGSLVDDSGYVHFFSHDVKASNNTEVEFDSPKDGLSLITINPENEYMNLSIHDYNDEQVYDLYNVNTSIKGVYVKPGKYRIFLREKQNQSWRTETEIDATTNVQVSFEPTISEPKIVNKRVSNDPVDGIQYLQSQIEVKRGDFLLQNSQINKLKAWIEDSNGKTVLSPRKVDFSYYQEFTLPNLPKGQYILKYELSFEGKTYSLQEDFEIDDSNPTPPEKPNEPAEFETKDFNVTRSESTDNLVIGEKLNLSLTGSYQEGYKAYATVNEEQVELTYNAEKNVYEASYEVAENTNKIGTITGYIQKADGTKTAPKTVQLNKFVGATVKGNVTNGQGSQVVFGTYSTTVDEDGNYEIKGVTEGTYNVEVRQNNRTVATLAEPITPAYGKVTIVSPITVQKLQSVKFSIVENTEAATPVAGANVEITGPNNFYAVGKAVNGVFTTLSGKTTFTQLQSGIYRVTVEAKGVYKKQTIDITIDEDQDYTATPAVVLVAPNTVEKTNYTIEFKDQNGAAISNIDYLSFYSWNAQQAANYELGSYYMYKPKLQDGKLTIENVAYAKDYTISVYKDGYRNFIQSPITVDKENKTITVTLDQGKTVTGKLIAPDGQTLTNPEVIVSGGDNYRHAQVDTDGSFTVNGISGEVGDTLTVKASALNLISKEEKITLTDTSPISVGNITLEAAGYIEGKVVDTDQKPVLHAYVTAMRGNNYAGFARTDKNGYFKLYNLDNEGTYTLHISNYNLPSISVEADVKSKETYVLQPQGTGSFAGEGNTFSVSSTTVVPGKTLQYRLHYKNNGNGAAEDVPLQITLPSNVDIPSEGLLNGKKIALNKDGNKVSTTISKVEAKEEGTFVVDVKVKNDATDHVTASASIKNTETLTATTNVLFVTLTASEVTGDKTIKVYGNAKAGSTVEVYAGDVRLAEVQVDGRWWFANVKLPVDGTDEQKLTLYAKVKEGNAVNTSESVHVTYKPNIPKIEDVTVHAGWNGDVKLNPYTGLATFAIVEQTPLDTTVTFDSAVDEAAISFLGKEYPMKSIGNNKYEFDGRKLGAWSSYGEQLLELVFKKGDQTVRIPLMEIIVLIDPSGYVFEGSMSNKLEGVTAVVQEKKDDKWETWDAEKFGQINPQVTDTEGRYGWDVIQGDWRVIFTKENYDTYTSRIVKVPPPETQLNVALVRSTVPTASIATTDLKVNSPLTITFDRLMQITPANAANYIEVKDNEGNKVTGTFTMNNINGYKEQDGYFEEDPSKKLAQEVTFTPANNLAANKQYTVTVKDSITDYHGKPLSTDKTAIFTPAAVTSPPVGGGGGGIIVPTPPVEQPKPEEPKEETPKPEEKDIKTIRKEIKAAASKEQKELSKTVKTTKAAQNALKQTNKLAKSIKVKDGQVDQAQVAKAIGQYQAIANIFTKEKKQTLAKQTVVNAITNLHSKVHKDVLVDFVKVVVKDSTQLNAILKDLKKAKITTTPYKSYLTELQTKEAKKAFDKEVTAAYKKADKQITNVTTANKVLTATHKEAKAIKVTKGKVDSKKVAKVIGQYNAAIDQLRKSKKTTSANNAIVTAVQHLKGKATQDQLTEFVKRNAKTSAQLKDVIKKLKAKKINVAPYEKILKELTEKK